MTIKDIELTTIDAKRFSRRGEKIPNIRIDNNSTVTLITMSGDEDAVVEFRFTANYGGVGQIRIEGTLIYEGEGRKLFEEWQKTGNMPNEIASEVHTAVMRVCVPEAVIVSRDLKLPPPMPLPQINIQAKKANSKAPVGMEVQ